MRVDVSACPAEGRFNRTTTVCPPPAPPPPLLLFPLPLVLREPEAPLLQVTFAPELVLCNLLAEPIVVWQRDTGAVALEAGRRPTCWVEPGQAHPFFPEGDRRKVRPAPALAGGGRRVCSRMLPGSTRFRSQSRLRPF